MKNKEALFITLEGGDGAGKSTLLEKLKRHFISEERDVVTTREPGATPLGASLRHLLLHEETITVTKRAELFLFLADRAQHVAEIIEPALKRGAVVISDRFFDSTIAYQGAARKFDLATIKEMSLFATDNLVPDATLFLDLDPEVGLKRAQNVDAPDKFEIEKLAFHKAVRSGFLAIAKQEPERFHRIDATLSPDDVFKEALACLS